MKNWLVSRRRIAQHCGIHPDTLRKRWMKKYKMPIVKIGGRWFADPYTLDEWLNYPYRKMFKKP